MRRLCSFAFVYVLIVLLAGGAGAADEASRIGQQIKPFRLKNQFGKDHALASLKQDVVVVTFLGTECPLAKLYAPRLADLAKELPKNKVAFLAIDSNQQDSIEEIKAFAERNKIGFPVLKDVKNMVADHFGAIRTPEVFVLDKNRVVRYWGRVDDQYGFAEGLGYQRPEPTRRDLVEAVKELLAGKEVSVPQTEALGCHIGRIKNPVANSEVTYSNQIARIFQQHCVECHREGRIGPFVMTSYDEVLGWGEMIREVVDNGRMPPWHANPAHGNFRNASRLTDEEKQLIRTWVDNGSPEGDKSQLPEPREFVEGWSIGKPDQIIHMRNEPVKVPAEGVIDYYHFVVDPGWTEDKWIVGAEAKPGSLETVHHILVFVLPPDKQPRDLGEGAPRGRRGGGRRGGGGGGDEAGALTNGNLIAAYAPGANALFNEDGKTAVHVKAGSKLVFQMHYTPNGYPQEDLSYVGFRYTDPSTVENEARSSAVLNTFFSIPAGANDYSVTAEKVFDYDSLIVNMSPHLHTRGKAFRYELFYPDGTNEVILDVPQYDFNWQTTYQLAEPKKIPKGTKLVCTAWWDNSEENLSNPDPTKVVTWGEQTFEEMMIGFFVEQFPKGQAVKSSINPLENLDPKQVFAQMDADKDGKLSQEEVPAQFRDKFQFLDTNGDGFVSEQELNFVLKLIQGGRKQP